MWAITSRHLVIARKSEMSEMEHTPTRLVGLEMSCGNVRSRSLRYYARRSVNASGNLTGRTAVSEPARPTVLARLLRHSDPLELIDWVIEHDPYLRGPETRRAYRRDLVQFELWRRKQPGAPSLSRLLAERYLNRLLNQGKAPSTVNRALACLRWWAKKVLSLASAARLPAERKAELVEQLAPIAEMRAIRGTRPAPGREIEPDELAALLRVCAAADAPPTGKRDLAVIALAAGTGLRREELAHLQFAHLKRRKGVLHVVVEHGKGDQAREVPILDTGILTALDAWKQVRGSAPGPLFYRGKKNGELVEGQPMSGTALENMLHRRAEQAGLEALTWHDFRRTFITQISRESGLHIAQLLAGHADPKTTARYLRLDEQDKQDAVRGVHVPIPDLTKPAPQRP